MDVQPVEAKVRHAVLYTPAAGAIPNGPCDYILVDTDLATVTVVLEQDVAGGAGGNVADAPFVFPLAAGMWHPMSASKLTALSAGNVWLGWLKVPAQNKG